MKQTTHPEVLRAITLQHIEEKYNTNLHIYTDGAVNSAHNRSGAGYFIPSTKETFLVPANSKVSVDSELPGINAALVYALTSNEK
jgi:ribonuclease HI